MSTHEFVLNRDCRATLVPAGDDIILEKDTTVKVTQALGGTVTISTPMGLFRVNAGNLDALGPEAVKLYGLKKSSETPAAFSEELVWEALRECYDPEIPLNIVELGLIYDLAVEAQSNGKNKIFVKMTLTAPGCGMGPVIANDAKMRIEALPDVQSAEIVIVWDPVWNPNMISPDGRKQLGLE
ncbi:MAG: iron-sulfur cluster assembly protein [Puniceicoccales bacterium]|jgi:probable FeS assembly SUF system protein SufT|nr:iron-sulfur cluster assembly protein [Puniceicoccales bacterium]